MEGRIEDAIIIAERELSNFPKTVFHNILGKNLLHITDELNDYLENFYNQYKKQIDIKALYSEMNGFTINYDLWFITLMAFEKCENLDDLDWLADYEIFFESAMTITGLEDLQAAYKHHVESEEYLDDDKDTIAEICSLLIILRLQELFKETQKIAFTNNLNWPKTSTFVTAHDSEMVYRLVY